VLHQVLTNTLNILTGKNCLSCSSYLYQSKCITTYPAGTFATLSSLRTAWLVRDQRPNAQVARTDTIPISGLANLVTPVASLVEWLVAQVVLLLRSCWIMSVSILVQVQFIYLFLSIYFYLFILIEVSYTTLTVNSRNYCFQCDSSCLTCKGSSSS
jgi:hypothetical protein